ncbi:MAG TPA: lytic transglycosylase domain-containing protein [Rhizomicrobium sp.]|nr:lytic transglycosylase domain-containing protein [Rhizomicrobium sp.]
MNLLRTTSIAGCAVALGALAAFGQASRPLPAGLTQQGGVIMMRPISDSDSGPDVNINGERRASLVPVLSAADHDIYMRAFDAADRGDWVAAKGLAAQGHDATANKLIQWRYLLDKNSGANFPEISSFILNNPDWPARDTLFARAEKAISPNTDPHAVVAFFGDRTPVTGLGEVRLGEALIATGNAARGRKLIQQGWVDGSFETNDELDIISRHGDILTPAVDAERLSHLLLLGQVTAAKREMSRVTADQQRVAQVRIQLKSSPSAGLAAADNLPAALQNDPGLVYDKVKAFERLSDLNEIAALAKRAPVREIAAQGPKSWWAAMSLSARDALQAKNYRAAYDIAANTGLTPETTANSGIEYAEAQFFAGWIALRFLNQPQTALTHFHALARAVSRPISKGRAYYWVGRAWEAFGDLTNAATAYHTATQAPETFYGQLALAKIDSTPHLDLVETPATAATAAYDGDKLSAAIRVLADLGEESLLRIFAVQDATVYDDAGHIKALCADLTKMGFREIAVRVAKQASYEGIYFWNYLYPTVSVPAYLGNGTAPDPYYVHGIIRQETEFDPTAISAPGARGLMQVMPSSGRVAAQQAGLTFRLNDLTADTTYNMQLGMTELGARISDYNGSLVLAAAAYNAGPGNVSKWLDTYGDPRSPTTDPIDWIESIPFSETRNYVQRVLDNMEVYRVRLSGPGQTLQIVNDVWRPRTADIKVLHYAPPAPPQPAPTPKPESASN